MLKITHFTSVSALCIYMAAGLSQAQTVPDAGALMRQTEQKLKFDQMQRNAQRYELLPPAMVLTEATQVTVTRIKFAGASVCLRRSFRPWCSRMWAARSINTTCST